MGLNERDILQDTLEIQQDRLIHLQEQKVLLNMLNKKTDLIDTQIVKCKQEIEKIHNKINNL